MEKYNKDIEIEKVRPHLLSDDEKKSISNGEVTTHEARSNKFLEAVEGGLLCPRIFGSEYNYRCKCGKYSSRTNRGITCDVCKVTVDSISVRRLRFGHFDLKTEVLNPYFLRSTNNYLSIILGISMTTLKQIVYFELFLVIDEGESKEIKRFTFTDRDTDAVRRYGVRELIDLPEDLVDDDDKDFELDFKYSSEPIKGYKSVSGGEAIKILLERLNLKDEAEKCKIRLETLKPSEEKTKLINKLNLLKKIIDNKVNIKNIVFRILLLLPATFRPLTELYKDKVGGLVNSSFNSLYKEIILTSQRYVSALETGMMLDDILYQGLMLITKSVSDLFDVNDYSFAKLLSGKEGYLREVFLGKRADYTGRATITPGADLDLDMCYIPREMALEIYKPLLISKLREKGLCDFNKQGNDIIYNRDQIIWEELVNIVKEYGIALINRQPSLHKYAWRSYRIKLHEGKTIMFPPEATKGYNADYDGDTVLVIVPLTVEEQAEALLVSIPKNIGAESNGELSIALSKDITLGIYVLTLDVDKVNKRFNEEEIERALDNKLIKFNDLIEVYIKEYETINLYTTTAGRVLIWSIIPRIKELNFNDVNKVLTSKDVNVLINKVRLVVKEEEELAKFIKDLRCLGFDYSATGLGSFSLKDFSPIKGIEKKKEDALNLMIEYAKALKLGYLSKEEYNNKLITIGTELNNFAAIAISEQLKTEKTNPINHIITSGARGSLVTLSQTMALKGLVLDDKKDIKPTPILRGYIEGLDPFSLYYTVYSLRSSLIDTALNTSVSGYLWRKLFSLSCNSIIDGFDCNSNEYILIYNLTKDNVLLREVYGYIKGRVSGEVYNKDEKLILARNTLITDQEIQILKDNGITEVPIRSPLTCKVPHNRICVACYGSDLSKRINGIEGRINGIEKLVPEGKPVGIIAAQSVSEPTTQLSLSVFHRGGVATLAGMVNSIKALYEGTIVYDLEAINNEKDLISLSRRGRIKITNTKGQVVIHHDIPYGSIIKVKDGDLVNPDTIIALVDNNLLFISEIKGKIHYVNIIEGTNSNKVFDEIENKFVIHIKTSKIKPYIKLKNSEEELIYYLPNGTILSIEDNVEVNRGVILGKTRQKVEIVDITSKGLPRIISLLELREPKVKAIFADIDGKVKINISDSGKYNIEISNDKEKVSYSCKDLDILVHNGSKVTKGDMIVNGEPYLEDLLRIKGLQSAFDYLYKEIIYVYNQQGLSMNGKHFEVIFSKMFSSRMITNAGKSDLLAGTTIEKWDLNNYKNKGVESYIYPIGITQKTLEGDFLSAIAFQNTVQRMIHFLVTGDTTSNIGYIAQELLGMKQQVGTGYIINKLKEEAANRKPKEEV